MQDKLLMGMVALAWLLVGCSQPATSPTPAGVAPTPIREATPTPATLATVEPTPMEVLLMVPYTNEALDLRAVAPTGWDEVRPGMLARGDPDADLAMVQLTIAPNSADDLLADLTDSYGLAQMPQRNGERQANDFTWSLYSFEAQGIPRDLALAERDGVTFIVILRSAADERDALYESVLLPVVDALEPVE
jgi:hypothetical protein